MCDLSLLLERYPFYKKLRIRASLSYGACAVLHIRGSYNTVGPDILLLWCCLILRGVLSLRQLLQSKLICSLAKQTGRTCKIC